MERRAFLSALAGLAATAAFAPAAEAATWVHIGRKKVSLYPDYDVLHVGAHRGLFRKLRFKVTGNALQLHHLHVVYANGGVDDIPVNWYIPQGGLTRVIDLHGNRRAIEQIQFLYSHPMNFKGKARVTVWGRR
jgi:hypothetical protein